MGALVEGAVVIVGIIEAEAGDEDELFGLFPGCRFDGCLELGPAFEAVFSGQGDLAVGELERFGSQVFA